MALGSLSSRVAILPVTVSQTQQIAVLALSIGRAVTGAGQVIFTRPQQALAVLQLPVIEQATTKTTEDSEQPIGHEQWNRLSAEQTAFGPSGNAQAN